MPILTQAELSELQTARGKMCPQNKGNKGRQNFQTSLVCCVCGRKKHHVKWEARMGSEGTLAAGSWCYACKRAAKQLACGWKIDVLNECPSALKKLQALSAVKAQELQELSLDVCQCVECSRPKKAKETISNLAPTHRVKGKSALRVVAVAR